MNSCRFGPKGRKSRSDKVERLGAYAAATKARTSSARFSSSARVRRTNLATTPKQNANPIPVAVTECKKSSSASKGTPAIHGLWENAAVPIMEAANVPAVSESPLARRALGSPTGECCGRPVQRLKKQNGADHPAPFFAGNRAGSGFFYSVNVKVTGAARLYRAASVWTAGLDIACNAANLIRVYGMLPQCCFPRGR